MLELLSQPVYRFADVEVDAARGCVRRGGEELHLRQQTFQVLLYLIERRERLVTKEELFEHIWQGAAVTDNALLQCIFDIRRTLGDDSRQPRFVKTVPKSGYRFIGEVEASYATEATVEIEEVTALQVEYEQTLVAEPHDELATHEAPARRPTLFQRANSSQRLRAALAVASVLCLAAAAVLSVQFFRKARQADEGRAAEVTLPHAPGKRTLAVMLFENRSGDPQADWLREGLADMLITDLSRSPALSVLGRQQLHLLLERAGHAPERDIRLDEALGVARGISAEAVMLGGFAYVGGKVRVDAQLYDARTGQMLAAESMNADAPEQILTQIDILSAKLAAHLGDASGAQDVQAGLADVMTDNLEAYRCYSLAVEQAQGMHSTEAIALLERAVQLDPKFAMAHARIGYTYAVTWGYAEKARPYLEKAFQLSERLTPKDRLYIAAWYAIAKLDYPGAIKAFREVVAEYPLDTEAHLRLVRLLRGEGQHEEALEVARQALAVDARDPNLYNALGLTYSDLGRHEEALSMFRRYVELAPNEPNAYDSLGLGLEWAGRYAEAAQTYEHALALNPKFEVAIVHLGNTYFQQGRYRDALAQYRRYIEAAPAEGERARGYSSLALVHLRRGEFEEAQQAVRKSATESEANIIVAAERGDMAEAAKAMERYLAHWPTLTDRGARASTRLLAYLNGYNSLKQGHTDEAIEYFRETLRQRPPIWNIDAFEDCLANAYLELGRLDEAVAEYERILRLNPNYPLAQYHLAQAFERQGQAAQAQAAYERFLQTWPNADADLPEVVAARKYLAR